MLTVDQKHIGVYCLANDNVLDWMTAFLESFREHEPDRRLVIIPFDQKIDRLAQLADRYHFEFLSDPSLEKLDAIGDRIHPGKYSDSHMFRKFAAFWGSLENFIFLDSDIVLLGKLDELFESYQVSSCDFMHYDTSVEYVYKAGSFRDEMIKLYHSTGFNTGCFASSQGKLSLEDVLTFSQEALAIKDFFACGGEQPFLNYCVDRKGLKKDVFFHSSNDLAHWTWGNITPVVFQDGSYRFMNSGSEDFGKRVLFLHWSGILSSPFMPNRHLFLKYRLRNLSAVERCRYLFYDWWRPGVRAINSKLKRKKGML